MGQGVPRVPEGLHWRLRVRELGLLHEQDVGARAAQLPGALLEAGLQGIDVPGRDAHAPSVYALSPPNFETVSAHSRGVRRFASLRRVSLEGMRSHTTDPRFAPRGRCLLGQTGGAMPMSTPLRRLAS